jgi:HTH-type transcriptional regulator/antitoxin MqsA
MSVVDRALRVLKEKVDGIPAPETIRKVRTKLRLSQRRAGIANVARLFTS